MSFAALNQFTARVIAGYFSPDAEGTGLRVWLPPLPDAFPESSEGYTLEITSGVHRGPAKNRNRDLMGNLVETEKRFSVHMLLGEPPEGCPYLPIRNQTTMLIGHSLESAVAVRIIEFDELVGRIEMQVEQFTYP